MKQKGTFVIIQNSKKGPLYYTQKGACPASVDSWSPDIRKAVRMTNEQATNMCWFVSAHTWGAEITKGKTND